MICPTCDGVGDTGAIDENGRFQKCPTCGGSGDLDEAQYERWAARIGISRERVFNKDVVRLDVIMGWMHDNVLNIDPGAQWSMVSWIAECEPWEIADALRSLADRIEGHPQNRRN